MKKFLNENGFLATGIDLAVSSLIDLFLQIVAESEFIDRKKYILANKSEFEALIGSRNDLLRAKPGNKKPISFEEVFRECGFTKEVTEDNDVQILMWQLFGSME